MNNWNDSWLNAPITIALISTTIPIALTFLLNSIRKEENKKLEQKQEKEKKEIRTEIKELLKEQEKRVRLEEENKNWKMLNSWNEEDKEKYSKKNKEIENKFWQLRIILSYYGFEQKDIDKLVDGNASPLEWERKPEIQRKQKEITDKRFKCDRCKECNKKNSD